MAPVAGPFSCPPTNFPARLEDKRLFQGFQNQKTIDMMIMRSKIITIKLEIMNTRETLILKALQFKAIHTNSSSISAGILDKLFADNPDQADQITKNVCARIPLELANEMESVGSMLDLNKREIITMALHDFLEKAKSVVNEFDALPEGDD